MSDAILRTLTSDDLLFAQRTTTSKLEAARERGDRPAMGRLAQRIRDLERELARRAPKPVQRALPVGGKP